MRANHDPRVVQPASMAARSVVSTSRGDRDPKHASPSMLMPVTPGVAPALLTTDQAAAYLGMSEAKFHELRNEPWLCAPIVLGPRLLRWSRADLDVSIAAMPRRSTKPDEPAWLANARNERAKAAGAQG